MIVNNKLGLTLSGGGARGVAHLGVLKYLFEKDIKPSVISGASAGALVGAFIAAGMEPDEIYDMAMKAKFFSFLDLTLRRAGLFNTNIIERAIKKFIPHDSFEGLQIPLFVSVTDLTNARPLVFNEGSLSFAVKASCAFPLFFQPVHYPAHDIYLCDGGVMDNFPVRQVRAICSKVIGVNVNPLNQRRGTFGYGDMVSRIIRIATSFIDKGDKESCDVYLQPDAISRYSTFNTKNIPDIYRIGYEYAASFETQILELKKTL